MARGSAKAIRICEAEEWPRRGAESLRTYGQRLRVDPVSTGASEAATDTTLGGSTNGQATDGLQTLPARETVPPGGAGSVKFSHPADRSVTLRQPVSSRTRLNTSAGPMRRVETTVASPRSSASRMIVLPANRPQAQRSCDKAPACASRSPIRGSARASSHDHREPLPPSVRKSSRPNARSLCPGSVIRT